MHRKVNGSLLLQQRSWAMYGQQLRITLLIIANNCHNGCDYNPIQIMKINMHGHADNNWPLPVSNTQERKKE
jgi:hypothetical protein